MSGLIFHFDLLDFGFTILRQELNKVLVAEEMEYRSGMSYSLDR